jgi:hypothetical protein
MMPIEQKTSVLPFEIEVVAARAGAHAAIAHEAQNALVEGPRPLRIEDRQIDVMDHSAHAAAGK